jgi:transcription elongation factor Elf1
MNCPKCGATDIVILMQGKNELGVARCIRCDKVFSYKPEEDEDE